MKNPGPGAYPITFCINEKGTYFLAKYKNSCVRNFAKIEGKTKLAENKFPGPGAYDVSKANLSPEGKYILSRMHSSLAQRFSITSRKPLG
jgi:hypothetical protein